MKTTIISKTADNIIFKIFQPEICKSSELLVFNQPVQGTLNENKSEFTVLTEDIKASYPQLNNIPIAIKVHNSIEGLIEIDQIYDLIFINLKSIDQLKRSGFMLDKG